jgi:hypothetical protein
MNAAFCTRQPFSWRCLFIAQGRLTEWRDSASRIACHYPKKLLRAEVLQEYIPAEILSVFTASLPTCTGATYFFPLVEFPWTCPAK